MKKVCFALACLFLLSLTACAPEENTAQYQLYFPEAGESSGMVGRAVGSEDYTGEGTVDALLTALLAGPVKEGLSAAVPGEVHVLGWAMGSGLLRIDLSADYGELTGIDLTLAECCITLTLTQLEEVDKVRITAGGRDVAGRAHTVLSVDHMIFTGAEEEPRQVMVELYFPRSGGRGLGFEIRELTLTEEDDLYAAVAKALLTGPKSTALRSNFPEGLEVLNTRVEDGICYINFSALLLEDAPADLEEQELLLHAVVDTFGNLEGVDAVQILIEGAVTKNYGNTDTSLPLEPDLALLTRE